MYTDQGYNYKQNITLPNSNGDRSRFRIQLSRANSCHCVTIDSVSGPYGPSMLDEWSDLWNNQQNLCASDQPKNFISKTFDFRNKNRVQATGNTNPTGNGCSVRISFPPSIRNNTICMSILRSFCSTSDSASTTIISPSTVVSPAASSTAGQLQTASIKNALTEVSITTAIPFPSSTGTTGSSSRDVSPTPLFCPAEGSWNQTLACDSASVPAFLCCLSNESANGYGK